MVDKVESIKNLASLKADKVALESLNHLNSTHAFKSACQVRIRQISEQIQNIKNNLGVK